MINFSPVIIKVSLKANNGTRSKAYKSIIPTKNTINQ